ncbi:MAG: 50S ribosomal protein L5 [bacterium]
MTTFKEQYLAAVPALLKELGESNIMALPRVTKVTLNAGLSKGLKDAKFTEAVERTLRRISGQQPVKTLAKKSISNFKIREGMEVGMMVTLRGIRMEHFLEKLVAVTLPRVRDFQGLPPKSIDQNGNLSLGFKEMLAFPEIGSDELENLHGLEVTISTNAKSKARGFALFKALGFPFKKDK